MYGRDPAGTSETRTIQVSEVARLTMPATIRVQSFRGHGIRVQSQPAASAGHTAQASSMYVWNDTATNSPAMISQPKLRRERAFAVAHATAASPRTKNVSG